MLGWYVSEYMNLTNNLRSLCLCACALSLGLAASVHAQRRPALFTVSGGVAYPIANQEFADSWNTGLNIGVGMLFPLKDRLAATFSIEANNLPLDDRTYLRGQQLYGDGNTADEGSATVLAANFGAKISFSRARTGEALYALFGGTIARAAAGDVLVTERVGSSSESYVVKGDAQTGVGLGAGLGFDVRLSPKSYLFFEARYTLLFTRDPAVHFVPLKMGIAFR